MKKLGDFYLNNALFFDCVIVIVIWLANTFLSFFQFTIASKPDNIDVVGDTVSATISLAGFILASLTVIASMRSNITNRPPGGARNPLELFFSDDNYNRIVQVFKDSIVALILIFIVSYVFWISQRNFENYTIFKWLVCAITITFLSIARTLIVLFTIIKLDRSNI